jgi:dTDP-N-acetylfucosamine:lipid II N-acetylfucosaminyltransferase
LILHILNKDKFHQLIIRQFGDHPDSRFLLLGEFDYTNDSVISCNRYNMKGIIRNLDFNVIVFHSFSDQTSRVLSIIKNRVNIKRVWLPWGFDIYHHPKIRDNQFQFLSKYHYHRLITSTFSFKTFISKVFDKIFYDVKGDIYKNIDSNIDSFDIIATIIPQDFITLKKCFGNKLNARRFTLGYGDLNDLVFKDVKINGNDILLGNSGTIQNNHLEVIEVLNKINLTDSKVIIPMNYGYKKYIDFMKKYLNSHANFQYTLLDSFLPLKEYQELIKSCGIVIFNHNRQQAVGNIIPTLYLGAKLFISKDGVIGEFLESLKVKFFYLEELNYPEAFIPLKDSYIKHNKAVIESYYSPNIVKDRTNKFYSYVESC